MVSIWKIIILNQTYKPTEVKQLCNQINSQYNFFKFKIYLVDRAFYEIAENAYAFCLWNE